MSDPRVIFAAERTLLAWIRTGLTIMGFGFVVARFGLFLRVMAEQHAAGAAALSPHGGFSDILGIALVLLGAIAMAIAAFEYHAMMASLPTLDMPSSRRTGLPMLLAFTLSALGMLIAFYLVL